MSIIKLRKAEKELFAAVEHGDKKKFDEGTKIRAEVLRHIVLGLPLAGRGIWPRRREVPCATTGAGVSIEGATIEGRVRLGAAISGEGSAIYPLEFRGCVFQGGFSAAHAHFSRLNFQDCTFMASDGAIEPDRLPQSPVIDLTGARLEGDLDLHGVGPCEKGSGLFWIRAQGIAVNGGIDLSGCELRRPPPSADKPTPDAEDALNLTLAKINGDLALGNGTMDGGLKLRSGQIGGNVWLNGATVIAGDEADAVFMQGSRIGGFLIMNKSDDKQGGRAFTCNGDLNLTAVEVELGLHLTGSGVVISGDISSPDLSVKLDFYLGAAVSGIVDLRDAKIGGTLDISSLRIGFDQTGAATESVLCLRGATIGRSLLVARNAPQESHGSKIATDDNNLLRATGFRIAGEVDLTAVSCDTLDDDIGRSWGKDAIIRMDHFTYRRNADDQKSDEFRQSSYRIVADWLQARLAEIKWPPLLFPKRAKNGRFWRPWQLRRNWIYQQFDSFETRLAAAEDCVSITRHRIREHEYSPQPFEQAIRVARAEGREDFATHFEIHKQRLEWRFVNRGVRWPLGFVAITLSSLWLILHAHSVWDRWLTASALLVTLGLMMWGSWIRRAVCRRIIDNLRRFPRAWVPWLAAEALLLTLWLSHHGGAAWTFAFVGLSIAVILLVMLGTLAGVALSRATGGRPTPVQDAKRARAAGSKILTWFIYWIPAVLLFAWTDWYVKPFHFMVSTAIFIAIRLMAVGAHMIMRFGFGYMRRPVYAVITLIVAFLAGWGGVVLAKQRDMFVISAEPMAGLVATVEPGNVVTDGAQAVAPPPGDRDPAEHHDEAVLLAGSEGAAGGRFVRDVSCSHEISEPLYALDVLIPIVDLGEESRCEIRRFSTPEREPVEPSEMKFRPLIAAIPDLPLNDHRFWWWMKALYAIFGWIIVSLSILTFAQVNKVHAEPPHEHK